MSLFDDNRDDSRNNAAFNALFGSQSSTNGEDTLDRLNALESNAPNYTEDEGSSYPQGSVGVNALGASQEGGNEEGAQGLDVADGDDPSNVKISRARLVNPGSLVVFLLKNYIDREDNKTLFESLIRQEREVEEFCRRLYLRLVVDHDAGYAYVRSLTDEEMPVDAGQRPPQLLVKRALPFYDSLILILLRQRLLEFDVSGQFGRLVLERSEIISMVKTFMHNVNNDKRLDDNLNKSLENLISLGLLGRNRPANSNRKSDRDLERIEVKRIISVIVTPEILKQADEILESYVKHINEGGRSKNRIMDEDADFELDSDDSASSDNNASASAQAAQEGALEDNTPSVITSNSDDTNLD